MRSIKFGTDGWRAIIAKDYTVDNVKRVSEATAKWMLKRGMDKIVIGYDCRFEGRMFTQVSAAVFTNFGIKVFMGDKFASTPMVSLGVVKLKADLGVVITASHNPPSYNGFKLKSNFGGPTLPDDIAEVESLIPDTCLGTLQTEQEMLAANLLEFIDLEEIYYNHVLENFDLGVIKSSGVVLAYDGMFGAGQDIVRRLFPDAHLLHCTFNPSFLGQAPEPIARNLKELSDLIKSDSSINLGLANDGDADRIGLFDEDGEFVDSHHILLLLLYYMYEYKKQTGKVVITFSVTNKMKQLAEIYNCEVMVTKIGFKYIAEIMTKEDVLVGGEESGGLAVKGHIPERDGVWIGLMIMEFMAVTGKSLKQLIAEVYEKVGSFKSDRDDLHITEDLKVKILEKCESGQIAEINQKPVISTETTDGYKFFLSDDEWVMVRPSGTEPVLRVYAQAANLADVRVLLDAAHVALQNGLV